MTLLSAVQVKGDNQIHLMLAHTLACVLFFELLKNLAFYIELPAPVLPFTKI